MSRNGRRVGVAPHGGTDRSGTSHAVAEGGGQDAVRSDATWGDAPAGGVDLVLEGCGGSIGLAAAAAGGPAGRHLALALAQKSSSQRKGRT